MRFRTDLQGDDSTNVRGAIQPDVRARDAVVSQNMAIPAGDVIVLRTALLATAGILSPAQAWHRRAHAPLADVSQYAALALFLNQFRAASQVSYGCFLR